MKSIDDRRQSIDYGHKSISYWPQSIVQITEGYFGDDRLRRGTRTFINGWGGSIRKQKTLDAKNEGIEDLKAMARDMLKAQFGYGQMAFA